MKPNSNEQLQSIQTAVSGICVPLSAQLLLTPFDNCTGVSPARPQARSQRHQGPNFLRFCLAWACGLSALLAAAPAGAGTCNEAELAKLIATDAAESDRFGYTVAIDGNTAIVGAYGDNTPAGLDEQGSAYVFVRSGSVWTQQAKLTASDAAEMDRFGYSVAIDGETAIIGAYGDNTPAGLDEQGSAYVFVRSGDLWTQQAKLTASDAAEFDRFGYSVAIDGNTAIVGAYGDNTPAGLDEQGSAYVFVRSGGVWTQQTKLTASDAAEFDRFGYSVAIDGNTAIVGAFGDNTPAGLDEQGSAYVFVRSGGVWTQQAKLTASDAAEMDRFGYSVAINGNTVIVGAFGDNTPAGLDEQGSAYIFAPSCDDDGDGVLNVNDVCPNNAPGLPIDCEGRPLRDCNGDCAVNGLDVQCIVAEILNQ